MRILRIRAVMDSHDLVNRQLHSARPRLLGEHARVEVIGPDGEVIGLLACTAFHIECVGRRQPVRAHVTVDVAELDLLAVESVPPPPEDDRHG